MTEQGQLITFTDNDFREVCKFGKAIHYRAGDTIFRLGDMDRNMFFIVSGEVELVFAGGKGSKVIGEGKFFGELAFIIGEHCRTATALAKNDAVLVMADQSTVNLLLAQNPRLLFALLRYSCTYLLNSEQGLISDLKRKNEELHRTIDYLRRTREELDIKELAAQTDELTGLYNRRCLNEQLPKAMDLANMTKNRLGLIMLDLDGFKQVNDTFGHKRGDEVLQKVSGILSSATRKSDLPCRLGGDEFAILLPDITEERGINIAEKIRKLIREAFPVEARQGIKVSSSIGFTTYRGIEMPDELIVRADENLYKAKRQGKDRVICDDNAA